MYQKNWIFFFLNFLFFYVYFGFCFWSFGGWNGCCFVLVKMGKGGIFHVFWGFVIGYVPFCFASCMVVEIFKLSDDRDEGKIGVMKTKEGAIGMW